MLLRAKEDPNHRLNATIARSLDILQSALTKKFAIIAKRRGTSLKIIEFDLKINML
jgi:hypothetical protein